jgi:LytS/YehU family sensor histidine kinase
MMKAVIENSGAQKAIILMNSDSRWRVEASWDPISEKVEVYQTVNLSDATELLPTLVIELCIHAQKDIVLSNAAIDQKFCTDPYIDKNRTRSLLCMPIMNQGTMEGILYLENNLSTNVFTEDRVRILQLLATQFLIYIKNAKLFSGLLVKTEEAHLAEEEALRSDIAFLQAQIKPHFLFNAINTISAYSLEDPEATRELLAKLSDYLRESFDFKNRDKMVHLKKELDLVEAYLYIEKARFGDRLQIVYNIEENIDCLLPPLTIQPLVENAVQHGVSNRKGGGVVTISILKTEGDTVITVEDDGEGIEEETIRRILENCTERTGGVALANIQQRLLRYYGHGLMIERKETSGTKVTIRVAN